MQEWFFFRVYDPRDYSITEYRVSASDFEDAKCQVKSKGFEILFDKSENYIHQFEFLDKFGQQDIAYVLAYDRATAETILEAFGNQPLEYLDCQDADAG